MSLPDAQMTRSGGLLFQLSTSHVIIHLRPPGFGFAILPLLRGFDWIAPLRATLKYNESRVEFIPCAQKTHIVSKTSHRSVAHSGIDYFKGPLKAGRSFKLLHTVSRFVVTLYHI